VVDGRKHKISLGSYRSREEAATAYDAAARIFGNKPLNFPRRSSSVFSDHARRRLILIARAPVPFLHLAPRACRWMKARRWVILRESYVRSWEYQDSHYICQVADRLRKGLYNPARVIIARPDQLNSRIQIPEWTELWCAVVWKGVFLRRKWWQLENIRRLDADKRLFVYEIDGQYPRYYPHPAVFGNDLADYSRCLLGNFSCNVDEIG
jgi:hypothetical protein